MPMLIDAKVVEQQIKTAFEDSNPVLMVQMLRFVRKQPTVDAVPVVRCKDCRFIIDRADGTHGCYRHFVDDCNHDDFCSYGERRTDG